MHRIYALLFALALLVGTLASAAIVSADPLPYCKFGQKNTKPCQWPTPTTTAPKGPHCIERPIVRDGVLVCLTRGGGGFPHYVRLP